MTYSHLAAEFGLRAPELHEIPAGCYALKRGEWWFIMWPYIR